MKKMFVTVAVVLTSLSAVNANNMSNDSLAASVNQPAEIQHFSPEIQKIVSTLTDEETRNQHVVQFYDIDRLVIKNEHGATIRIYNDKWQLIEQTDKSVDRRVQEGNYFVSSTAKIKSKYSK